MREVRKIKKTLIIGSILAVFLMTMIPIASAVNSHYAKEAQTTKKSINVPEVDFEKIQKQYTLDPNEPTPILITLLIWLLKLMRIGMVAFWGIVFIIIRRFGNNTAI